MGPAKVEPKDPKNFLKKGAREEITPPKPPGIIFDWSLEVRISNQYNTRNHSNGNLKLIMCLSWKGESNN